MTIPKRRNYRLFFIAASATGVLISGLLIVTNTLFVRALTLPEALRSFDSFSQNSEKEINKRERQNANVQQPASTINAASPTPVATPPPRQVQGANKAPQAAVTRTAKVEQSAQSQAESQKPVDTSAAVRSVALEQADKPAQTTHYSTAKISPFERNRLYQASFILAGIGALLYMATYAPLAWQWIRRDQIGIRKTIAQ